MCVLNDSTYAHILICRNKLNSQHKGPSHDSNELIYYKPSSM